MSIYGKGKEVKNLVHEFAHKELRSGELFTKHRVIDWFKINYPKVKSNTVALHIAGMSVNYPEHLIHHPHIRPGKRWDLFWKENSKQYRLWEPEKDPQPLYGYDARNVISSEEQVLNDFANIDKLNISETEKELLKKSRIGQGKFRENVIKISGGTCRVTGIKNPYLLIASHIKPWCECNDTERLDRYNGLLLAPHIDKLFDRGLISFEDNGDMLVSETAEEVMQQWNISNKNVGAFPPKQMKYLKWHRENHYKKDGYK
jgi:hypothetical protein